MRLMGTLLISGLIVFPAISSMRVFKSYRGVVISSAIISVLCFLAGFILACFDLPTGAVENRMRSTFDFSGTPIRLFFRKKEQKDA